MFLGEACSSGWTGWQPGTDGGVPWFVGNWWKQIIELPHSSMVKRCCHGHVGRFELDHFGFGAYGSLKTSLISPSRYISFFLSQDYHPVIPKKNPGLFQARYRAAACGTGTFATALQRLEGSGAEIILTIFQVWTAKTNKRRWCLTSFFGGLAWKSRKSLAGWRWASWWGGMGTGNARVTWQCWYWWKKSQTTTQGSGPPKSDKQLNLLISYQPQLVRRIFHPQDTT